MCDCRTRVEAELAQKCRERYPDSTNHSARLEGYGIAITASLGIAESAYMVAQLTYIAKGRVSGAPLEKKLKVNMHMSHCPFCGERFERDQPPSTPSPLVGADGGTTQGDSQ